MTRRTAQPPTAPEPAPVPVPVPADHAETLTRMLAAEDTLRAIGAGEVDAFVVSDGGQGNVFSLSTADRPYRKFVEHMHEGAATVSAAGLVLYANRRLAELLCCPRESIVGASLSAIVAGGMSDALRALGRTANLGVDLEVELLGPQGVRVPVLVGASSLDVEGDRLLCLTFTDLSGQKEQEQEIIRLGVLEAVRTQEFALNLAETQKLEALGVLAGGIAHDFNNLLTVIIGSTTEALEGLAPDARARIPLEQVRLAAARSADLAQQMLAYSGKGTFVVQTVDLAAMVGGLTELIKAAISKKALLSFDFAAEVPPIDADATQLRQVILNLITNASEAIGDVPGTIVVRAGTFVADRTSLAEFELAPDLPAGRYAVLEVTDSGPGMDTATRERIFDPFFTTKFTGRGLGLAAVQGIVRGHHGAMKVRSELGAGTTFTLIFPASEGVVPAAPETVAPVVGRLTGTVLVVDDDEAVRAMAVRMLRSMGFTAVSALDGADGLRLLTERPAEFAFVLLDLMMPGMSGEEVLLELQQRGGTTPIILSSGYDSQELGQRLAGRGVTAILQKPYGLDELRATALRVMADASSS